MKCMPQEFAGFGDSKWDHMSEIEMLSLREDECGVWPETRETGITDCFSLMAH